MDLHSGLPWWLETNPRLPDFLPLGEPVECDVVVLGAGVTGALLAAELSRLGSSVVVLERGAVGAGSTAASTALLLAETDADFRELSKRYGIPAAARVWSLGRRAVDRIAELASTSLLDVRFERLASLYLARGCLDARALAREARSREAAGQEVELLDRTALAAISSFARPAALRSTGAAVDPYRLTGAALLAATGRGARVFASTEAKAVETTGAGVRVRTATEQVVWARSAVVASGYEAERFLGLDLGRLRTSYAIVASSPTGGFSGWPEKTLVWETGRPYLYARPLPDGRLLAGGADTAFAEDHGAAGRVARRSRKVLRGIRRLLPGVRVEQESAWAGTFGESRDALPWIGEIPGRSNVFGACGFGGNGITFAMIAAELLALRLHGERPDDLALFAFDR